MNVHQVATAVAGVAMAITAGVIAPTSAAASGHHTNQSFNGLNCRSSWYHTYGGTTCTGNPHQKWRLHVTCQMQPHHTGTWNYGPGSDGYECIWRITNASIEWG
jgi:hypothetical protein